MNDTIIDMDNDTLVANFSSMPRGGVGRGGKDGLASPGAWVATAHGLTLGCSCLALLLNSVLLLALIRGRVRERCSGMLILTGTELVLNLLIAMFLLGQIIFDANTVPDELGMCMHGAQMTRNWWMLILTAYRAVISARPHLAAQPGRRFPIKFQLGLLVAIIGLSILEYFAGSLWSLVDGSGGGNVTNAAQMMRSLRANLFKHLNYAVLGAILPGFCVLCLACRIAHSLRVRYASHRAIGRAARTILLLSVGFVALEFPYAVSNAVASGYLLNLLGRRPLMSEDFRTLELLEKLASWGMVVVPVNSCLNFFILLRYSRSFREILGRRTGQEGEGRERRNNRLQVRQHHQRTLAWQNHRAAMMRPQRCQNKQLRGPHRCEVVAMIERARRQDCLAI